MGGVTKIDVNIKTTSNFTVALFGFDY